MRTIIAGSRNITNYEYFCNVMKEIKFTPTVILSGGASGVDRMGEEWARANNIPVERYPANWNKYGKKAGYIRNKEMVDNADALIAVWDGKSKGTKLTIDLARDKTLRCVVIIHSVV